MIASNIKIVTEPACEPVSLAEARTWCRVDSDDTSQDGVLNLLIKSARERAEALTGRAFVQRQLEAVYDAFPLNGAALDVPGAPLISLDYITYWDTTGTQVTMNGSPDEWILDTSTQPGRVAPLPTSDWPSTQTRIGAVTVGFTCGYSFSGSPQDEAQQAALPASLRNWMQLRIASFFSNRESLMVGQAFQQPSRDFVDALLDQLVVHKGFA